MSSKIAFDVYRGATDRTLRLATMPGAGLPAHVKRKDWVLMQKGKSPLHSDVDRDVANDEKGKKENLSAKPKRRRQIHRRSDAWTKAGA